MVACTFSSERCLFSSVRCFVYTRLNHTNPNGGTFYKVPDYYSFFLFESGSCQVAQAGLEFTIFLPQPPEYWDLRRAPPRLALTTTLQKFQVVKDKERWRNGLGLEELKAK
jgi:hypothetical protein